MLQYMLDISISGMTRTGLGARNAVARATVRSADNVTGQSCNVDGGPVPR